VIQGEGLGHLSRGSLARILAENVLKPWRYTYWLFPRDPDFVSKACIVLDLYTGFWEGQRLGPDECVLSVDEKTIQANLHCQGRDSVSAIQQPTSPVRKSFPTGLVHLVDDHALFRQGVRNANRNSLN
jgi:hypothetical protein